MSGTYVCCFSFSVKCSLCSSGFRNLRYLVSWPSAYAGFPALPVMPASLAAWAAAGEQARPSHRPAPSLLYLLLECWVCSQHSGGLKLLGACPQAGCRPGIYGALARAAVPRGPGSEGTAGWV